MDHKVIVITGASRGLGAELAKLYAKPGVTLILTARSEQAIKAIATECASLGASIATATLDLVCQDSIDRFHAFLFSKLEGKSGDGKNIDLFIANAGVYSGRQKNGKSEPINRQREQITVNFIGTVAVVDPVAERMKARNSGHIALISSLAAIQPQPDSAAYSGSKAGLAVWGKGMSDDLADFDVTLSIVYPGHIQSDQTSIHVGALPGLVSAQSAALRIKSGLDRKKKAIYFPKTIYWLIRLSNLLPAVIRRKVNRPFRYYIDHTRSTRDE